MKQQQEKPKWADLPYFHIDDDWWREHVDSRLDKRGYDDLQGPEGEYAECHLWDSDRSLRDGYPLVRVPLWLAPPEVRARFASGATVLVQVSILAFERVKGRKVRKFRGEAYLLDHGCHIPASSLVDPSPFKRCKAESIEDCFHRRCCNGAHLDERTHEQNNDPERRNTTKQGTETTAQRKAMRMHNYMAEVAKFLPEGASFPRSLKQLSDTNFAISEWQANNEAVAKEKLTDINIHRMKLKGDVPKFSPLVAQFEFLNEDTGEVIHNPHRLDDWKYEECSVSLCENSPYVLMFTKIEDGMEVWEKVDDVETLQKHSHKWHPPPGDKSIGKPVSWWTRARMMA